MATRVMVKVLDLLNAGCMIKQKTVHHAAGEHEGAFLNAWTECMLYVEWPHGEVTVFRHELDGDVLIASTDFNAGSDDFHALLSIFTRYKILIALRDWP